MRSTLERKATPEEMALATRIVHAVRAATVAGRPLVGQLAVATAIGISGSARYRRRKVSEAVWLCPRIAPILYPGLIYNRTNALVYTVGTPTAYEQLQMVFRVVFTMYTKGDIAANALLAGSRDPDVMMMAMIINSLQGVLRGNEAILSDILARHAV